MDSHEFDHVFSFNGFLGFTKFSVAALLSSADVGVWVVCLMVSDWNRFYDNFRIGYWPQYYKCIFSIIELIYFSINAIVYSKISSRSAEKFTSIYSPMENNVFRALKNEVHPKIYNSL